MLTSRKVTISQELAIMCIHIATVSDETFEGENLHDFYSNRECFTPNILL